MRSRTIVLFLIGGTATLFTVAATPAQIAPQGPSTQPQSTATTRPADHGKPHGRPMRPHPSFEGEQGPHGGRPPMGDHFMPPMHERFGGPDDQRGEERDDKHSEAHAKSSKHHGDDHDDDRDNDGVEELTKQVRKLREQISDLQDTVDDLSHQLKHQSHQHARDN